MKKLLLIAALITLSSCSKNDSCQTLVTDKSIKSFGPTINTPLAGPSDPSWGTRNPGKVIYYLEVAGSKREVSANTYRDTNIGDCK